MIPDLSVIEVKILSSWLCNFQTMKNFLNNYSDCEKLVNSLICGKLHYKSLSLLLKKTGEEGDGG